MAAGGSGRYVLARRQYRPLPLVRRSSSDRSIVTALRSLRLALPAAILGLLWDAELSSR